MSGREWEREFPGAITVCDREGIILEMNDRSARVFAADGGRELVGKNLLDCHPEPARTKLKDIMDSRQTNVYTIEKRGVKKMIYQALWFEDGQYAGHVELSFEIPWELPHHKRD